MTVRLSTDQKALANDLKAALTPESKARDLVGEASDATKATALLETAFAGGEDLAHRIMDAAAQGSKRRGEALTTLLIAMGDTAAPIADSYLQRILADPDHPLRNGLVQRLAFASPASNWQEARRRFLPALTRIAEIGKDPDWSFAVMTLGKLARPGDMEAIYALMDHTGGPDTPFVVLSALNRFAPPEAAIVFEMISLHPVDKRHEVIALSGLGKLGSLPAIGALIDYLEDPVIQTERRFSPGEGPRAARALAEIHDWDLPDAWRGAVAEAKRLSASIYPDGFRHACKRARSLGRLFDKLDDIMSLRAET